MLTSAVSSAFRVYGVRQLPGPDFDAAVSSTAGCGFVAFQGKFSSSGDGTPARDN